MLRIFKITTGPAAFLQNSAQADYIFVKPTVLSVISTSLWLPHWTGKDNAVCEIITASQLQSILTKQMEINWNLIKSALECDEQYVDDEACLYIIIFW